MTRITRVCRLLLVITATLAWAVGARSQPVLRLGGAGGGSGTDAAPHTRPSLIARTTAAQRGGVVEIALRLQLDPEWHVYWVNPGDAGLPPRLKWTLPAGAAVSEIDWPAPHYRRDEHGLVTYLYEGDVVLPLTLTLDDHFVGDRVELVVDASWLVCREACLPGKARLALELPVVDTPPEEDAASTAGFASADQRRPIDVGPDAVRRTDDLPGRFSLDLDAGPLGALDRAPDVVARIMPQDPGRVDEASPHTAVWSPGGSLRVSAPRGNAAATLPDAGGFVEVRHGDVHLVFRFGPHAAGRVGLNPSPSPSPGAHR